MSEPEIARIDSERRRVEEALREREELDQLLMENANDLFRLHDLEGRTVNESRSVERFCGLIPTQMFAFAHPEDVERCEQWWKRVVAGGKDHLIWRARDADENWHWLETAGSLVQYRGQPHVLTVCRDITQRRQAEEALRRSEAALAEAQRAARIGSWCYEIASHKVWWSQELFRIFDVEKAAIGDVPEAYLPESIADRGPGLILLGMYEAFFSRVHPYDRSKVLKANADAIASGEPFEVEYRITTAAGRLKHIREVGYAEKDSAGGVSRLFGTAQDITERKGAQEALLETTAKLNEAQRLAHLGHWEMDLDTCRISASDETYRIFGLAPQEDLLTWATWPEHLHRKDRAIQITAILRALQDGSPYEVEYRVVRRDGDIRIIHSQGEIECDVAGRPRRLFGIVQDITERRHAEDALRAAEHRLQHVSASTPAVLFNFVAEPAALRLTWISENVSEIMGYQVEEVFQARWWHERVHPDDLQRVQAEMESALFAQGRLAIEYRFRHKNGEYRWVRSDMRLLRDAANDPIEVVGSWSDVTERKQVAEKFRQAQG